MLRWWHRLPRGTGGGGLESRVDRGRRHPVCRRRRRAGDVVQRLAEGAPVSRTSEQDRNGTSLLDAARLTDRTSSGRRTRRRRHLPGQIRFVLARKHATPQGHSPQTSALGHPSRPVALSWITLH